MPLLRRVFNDLAGTRALPGANEKMGKRFLLALLPAELPDDRAFASDFRKKPRRLVSPFFTATCARREGGVLPVRRVSNDLAGPRALPGANEKIGKRFLLALPPAELPDGDAFASDFWKKAHHHDSNFFIQGRFTWVYEYVYKGLSINCGR